MLQSTARCPPCPSAARPEWAGHHHGIGGVREFSNLRAVYVRGEGDMIELRPPYGPAAQAVVGAAFGGAS